MGTTYSSGNAQDWDNWGDYLSKDMRPLGLAASSFNKNAYHSDTLKAMNLWGLDPNDSSAAAEASRRLYTGGGLDKIMRMNSGNYGALDKLGDWADENKQGLSTLGNVGSLAMGAIDSWQKFNYNNKALDYLDKKSDLLSQQIGVNQYNFDNKKAFDSALASAGRNATTTA